MAWTGIIVGAATGALAALCVYPLVNRFIKNETAKRWTYFLIFLLTLALSREFLQPPIERYIVIQNLEETLLSNPAFAALKEFEPPIYAAFVEKAKEGIRSGESASTIRLRANAMVQALVLKRVPVASNAAALAYMKVSIQEVDFLYSKGGEACFLALFPNPKATDTPFADIPASMMQADLLALAEVLRTARLQPQAIPTEDEFAVAAVPAQQFFVENAVELQKISEAKVGVVARRRACEITINLYKELFKLPPAQAGITMRYLISGAS